MFVIFNLSWESCLQTAKLQKSSICIHGKKSGCLCSQGQFTLHFYKSVNRPEKLALSTVQKENARISAQCGRESNNLRRGVR